MPQVPKRPRDRLGTPTSFPNPAVTVARSFTDTFFGIDPVHMPLFIIALCVGAVLAAAVCAAVFTETD